MKALLDCGICGGEFRVDMVRGKRGDQAENRELGLYAPEDSNQPDLWDGLCWEAVCDDCEKAVVESIRASVEGRKARAAAPEMRT
jgi:hypothetical protein